MFSSDSSTHHNIDRRSHSDLRNQILLYLPHVLASFRTRTPELISRCMLDCPRFQLQLAAGGAKYLGPHGQSALDDEPFWLALCRIFPHFPIANCLGAFGSSPHYTKPFHFFGMKVVLWLEKTISPVFAICLSTSDELGNFVVQSTDC